MAARRQALRERLHRRDEDDAVVGEAPPLVHRAGTGVRGSDLQLDVRDPARRELLDDRAGQGGGDALLAVVGRDVEVGQHADVAVRVTREREARRGPVLLGEEREARADDLAHLSELALGVVRDVRRRRHLALERTVELLEHGQVVCGRGADAHGEMLVTAAEGVSQFRK